MLILFLSYCIYNCYIACFFSKYNYETKSFEKTFTSLLRYEKLKFLAVNVEAFQANSIDLEMKNEEDVEYPYKYVEIDGNRFRVPVSVLGDLKAVLKANPTLKYFKVTKIGEGKKTQYTLIPLME